MEKVFLGTKNGEILVSMDHGQNWNTALRLHENCEVNIFSIRHGVLYVEIVLLGNHFGLKSTDGKVWKTLEAI